MMKHQKVPQIVHAQAMPEDTPEVPVCIVGGGACGLTTATGNQKEYHNDTSPDRSDRA